MASLEKWSLLVTADWPAVITDHWSGEECLSYLWPTLDMMASLESVPVPASAVALPAPPTLGLADWKSLKPRLRLRGLPEVSPSFDLEIKVF